MSFFGGGSGSVNRGGVVTPGGYVSNIPGPVPADARVAHPADQPLIPPVPTPPAPTVGSTAASRLAADKARKRAQAGNTLIAPGAGGANTPTAVLRPPTLVGA